MGKFFGYVIGGMGFGVIGVCGGCLWCGVCLFVVCGVFFVVGWCVLLCCLLLCGLCGVGVVVFVGLFCCWWGGWFCCWCVLVVLFGCCVDGVLVCVGVGFLEIFDMGVYYNFVYEFLN